MQSSQLKSILDENALVPYEPGSEVVLREDVTELAVTQMPPGVTVVDVGCRWSFARRRTWRIEMDM